MSERCKFCDESTNMGSYCQVCWNEKEFVLCKMCNKLTHFIERKICEECLPFFENIKIFECRECHNKMKAFNKCCPWIDYEILSQPNFVLKIGEVVPWRKNYDDVIDICLKCYAEKQTEKCVCTKCGFSGFKWSQNFVCNDLSPYPIFYEDDDKLLCKDCWLIYDSD